jgi:hypothetical protein
MGADPLDELRLGSSALERRPIATLLKRHNMGEVVTKPRRQAARVTGDGRGQGWRAGLGRTRSATHRSALSCCDGG